jgi:hypothetical protein
MESTSIKRKYKKPKRSDRIPLRLDSYVEGKFFADIQMMLNENNRAKLKLKSAKGIKPRNRNNKYIAALNCLLANLVEAALQELPLSIGHREDFYKKKQKTNPKKISAYVMKAVLTQLSDKNLALIRIRQKAFYNKKNPIDSTTSLYEPTKDFDLFKRMATKGEIQLYIRRYRQSAETKMKADAYESDESGKRIYYNLDCTRPDVARTIRVLTALDTVLQLSRFTVRSISIEAPTFYRSFSKDYSKHGRIYSDGGSFQNWKKKFIKDLIIDGQPTVELDYSTTHTAIAYAIKGVSLPSKDVYVLNSLSPILNDKLRRRLGKVFTNIMLNADSRNAAAQAIGKAFADLGIKYKSEFGISIPDIIEEITERHGPIKSYFFSGAGLALMKVESDICIEIVDKFTQLNKPIIPKHDSFIVKAEDEKLLQQTMVDAWITVISKIQEQNSEVQVPNISKKEDDSLF